MADVLIWIPWWVAPVGFFTAFLVACLGTRRRTEWPRSHIFMAHGIVIVMCAPAGAALSSWHYAKHLVVLPAPREAAACWHDARKRGCVEGVLYPSDQDPQECLCVAWRVRTPPLKP